jgi:hypothetical protein
MQAFSPSKTALSTLPRREIRKVAEDVSVSGDQLPLAASM